MKTRLSLSLLLMLLCAFMSFAQKPEPILQLGHTGDITVAAFVWDGKVLISSSKDNMLKLWNTATGELLQTIEDATFVSVSPNGRTLLTIEAQRLKLRDIQTGRTTVLKTEPIPEEAYSREYPQQITAFSADGKRLLRIGPNPLLGNRKSKGIQIWNPADGSFKFIPLLGNYDYASAIFSSDGEILIAHKSENSIQGSAKKNQAIVRVLKAETGKEIYTLKLPLNEEFKSVSLSPDNKILMSQSELKISDSKYQTTAIFFDARTGKELHREEKDGVDFKLTFSPSEPIYASVGTRPSSAEKSEPVITISDAMTGKMIRELTVSEARTGITISFTPDGRTLAASYSSDDDYEKNSLIQLWDVATGERGLTFNSKKAEAEHLIFSNDGKLLLSLGPIYSADSMEIRDVAKGDLLHDFAGFKSGISSINISPDNKVLVIGEVSLSSNNQSPQIRLWSLTSGTPLQTPIQGEFKTFNKDGTMFVTEQPLDAENHRLTKLIVSSNGTEFHSFNGTFLRLSNDGKRVFTNTPQGVIVWDATTGNKIRTLTEGVSSEQIQSLAVSPEGQYLVIVRNDNPKIELISVDTGNVLRMMNLFTGHEKAPEGMELSLVFSPDSQLLAGVYGQMWDQHTIKMWRVTNGGLLYKATTGYGAGVDITFSPNGRILASTGNQLETLDARTGRHLHTFDVSSYVFETAEYGTSAFFSPDGKILAGVVGGGRTVNLIWDATTGRSIPLFRTPLDEASVISFSPDSKYVASLARDGVVRFRQLADSKLLARFVLFDDNVWLVMNPDNFFDGSTNAVSEFLWRRSPNLFDVVPGESYSGQFHSPHLLAHSLNARMAGKAFIK